MPSCERFTSRHIELWLVVECISSIQFEFSLVVGFISSRHVEFWLLVNELQPRYIKLHSGRLWLMFIDKSDSA